MRERSDALLFFGITGDLAYKKIFPALHAMAKRGMLDLPVVGVATKPWSHDELVARARHTPDLALQAGRLRDAETRLLGLLDPSALLLEAAGKRAGGAARRFGAGARLVGQIRLRDRVGDVRGLLGVARRDGDVDHQHLVGALHREIAA